MNKQVCHTHFNNRNQRNVVNVTFTSNQPAETGSLRSCQCKHFFSKLSFPWLLTVGVDVTRFLAVVTSLHISLATRNKMFWLPTFEALLFITLAFISAMSCTTTPIAFDRSDSPSPIGFLTSETFCFPLSASNILSNSRIPLFQFQKLNLFLPTHIF